MKLPPILLPSLAAAAALAIVSSGARASGSKLSVTPAHVVDGTMSLRLEFTNILLEDGDYRAMFYPTSAAELALSDLDQPTVLTCDLQVSENAKAMKVEEYRRVGSDYELVSTQSVSAPVSQVELFIVPNPSGDYLYRFSSDNTWYLDSCRAESL